MPDADSIKRLERVLAPSHTVIPCDSADALERELGRAVCDALILDRVEPNGARTLDLVRRVRRRFPTVAIVLYCTPVPSLFHEIIEFSQAGIRELVLRGVDDLGGALQRTITIAAEAALADYAMLMLESRLSPRVADIVRICLSNSDGPLDVNTLARKLGVTRKTLAVWTAEIGAPSPSSLIGWSRVLMAARLLEDPGRSVESIAHALDFGSASALTNMVVRYAGESPSVLRTHGPVKTVLDRWVTAAARATHEPA